jgi:hypothetical protein
VVRDILVGRVSFFGDLRWRVAYLPISDRGLGLYLKVEASPYAFVAFRAQSWMLKIIY